MTAEKLERLKRDLRQIENIERPKTVEDLIYAREQGDLSENAEYQEAKAKLGRLDGRIFSIKERIKNAVIIEHGTDASGGIKVGSRVRLKFKGKERQFEIVGVQEADPLKGRISHRSPLGSALLGHNIGDVVAIEADGNRMEYSIESID